MLFTTWIDTTFMSMFFHWHRGIALSCYRVFDHSCSLPDPNFSFGTFVVPPNLKLYLYTLHRLDWVRLSFVVQSLLCSLYSSLSSRWRGGSHMQRGRGCEHEVESIELPCALSCQSLVPMIARPAMWQDPLIPATMVFVKVIVLGGS